MPGCLLRTDFFRCYDFSVSFDRDEKIKPTQHFFSLFILSFSRNGVNNILYIFYVIYFEKILQINF